jgi:4,5-DOPA dioxygenase extradiol
MSNEAHTNSAATKKMPVVFLGHGSPMNAIATNDFTKRLSRLGKDLDTPKAILTISAHWMTKGTFVTHMQAPRTIHDFQGFPPALYEIQYPAPGSPEIADLICKDIKDPLVGSDDHEWGLDHGTWSVLKHLYPKANIPVLQLSLDMTKPAAFHFSMGQKLRKLREHGVLLIGSGNIVHNLRHIDWDESAKPLTWATEFDQWVKQKIDVRDFKALVQESVLSGAGQLSIPTPDHYYPLLYILGAAADDDDIEHIYEGFQNASISMRSIQIG